ncbi:hypothetical protein LTR37_002927 [Vermiconidia calcicola]|uniref:Uncharacterized protein n=1 Tax=Vermiconidia calcicola TaxID=1690605 RepID=A0ACC3NRZ2_9PEZI|nr:hypothetical protein LTR37_002927 [Vermiconidia calcicola]
MSQLSQQLSQAADQNRELLLILRESDYAPPALKQSSDYIADLQSQIKSTDKELARLHPITEKERDDHVKYRDSKVRRFAHKLGGSKGEEKFTAKQEKEEREFLEAWQHEREAKERREELGKALEQTEKEKRTLDDYAKKHEQAQKQLDQLYSGIFSGPTPEVPGEDQKEEGVRQAQGRYEQCHAQLGHDNYATECLQRASASLSRALREMDSARSSSNMDRFGGGTIADMMERSALSSAQANLTECNRAVDEARRSQPAVPALSGVSIDHGHMLSDVLFDSFFADMAQHDRIKDSQAQMQRAMEQLQKTISEQNQRVQGAQEQRWQAARQLEDARAQLQGIRSEAFKHLAGSSGNATV